VGIEVKACTRLTTLCLRLHRQIDAICTDFENAISTDFEKAFDKVPSLRSVKSPSMFFTLLMIRQGLPSTLRLKWQLLKYSWLT